MSGILGLWNLDGQPVDKQLLEKMSKMLAHRGPDGEGTQIRSSIGMACQNLQVTPEAIGEIQPLVHPSGTVIVFDGRLDNRAEIIQALGIEMGSSSISDAAILLAAYLVHGENLPEQLKGDFAFALYDPERHMLLLARDSIGVRPLYYYRASNLFIFGSEIKTLLAHPMVSTRPNDKALAGFIFESDTGYGGVEGATFFENVFSVPPAHKVIVKTDEFKIEQYWDFDPEYRIRLSSFQDYVDVFHDHFERAVLRRIRSAFPVAVSVSGGLDSSSIFCQAETLRRFDPIHLPSVLGFSWIFAEGSPADEKDFLYAIEKKYGIEIHKIPMMVQGFSDTAAKAVWLSEMPFVEANQDDSLAFHAVVRQAGAKVVLPGVWGDQVLFDMAYLIDLFHRFGWKKILFHLGEYSNWMIDVNPNHFRIRNFIRYLLGYHMPGSLKRLRRRFRGRLSKDGETSQWYTEKLTDFFTTDKNKLIPTNNHGSAQFKSFYEIIKSSRNVLFLEHDDKITSSFGMEIAYPFLDRDLISFIMAIPGEIVVHNGQPKALLRHSMKGILPETIIERRWKADFTDQLNDGMEKNLLHLDPLLLPDAQAVKYGYTRNDRIFSERSKINQGLHGSNTGTLAWDLEKLFGLELWLELFLKDCSPRIHKTLK